MHEIHAGWIQDVSRRVMGHVLTARPVASFAAHVPFGHTVIVDVVVYRVAAVTGWSGGPLHVVSRIKRFPPIGARRDKIGTPGLMHHIPLRALGEIIISHLRKIALL